MAGGVEPACTSDNPEQPLLWPAAGELRHVADSVMAGIVCAVSGSPRVSMRAATRNTVPADSVTSTVFSLAACYSASEVALVMQRRRFERIVASFLLASRGSCAPANVFVIASVAEDVSLDDTFKGAGWYLAFIVVVFVLLMVFPSLATWLPGAMQ